MKGLKGCGRKVINDSLEEDLRGWIHERRARSLRVSRSLIMKKAN